jgi:hypothetical protein
VEALVCDYEKWKGLALFGRSVQSKLPRVMAVSATLVGAREALPLP